MYILLFISVLVVAVLAGFNETLTEDDSKIVGGQRARPGQFPYQVGLIFQRPDNSLSRCGGSLIARQWVLTAAHCTIG